MNDPRWCRWHKGIGPDTALVGVIETGSGPGGMLYACSRCRKRHGLTPLVDHPADSDGSPSDYPRVRT
ncbi:hypothetical protein ABZW18_07180 [Streptomyces sp. NPDC004647]|uniref:hypothetical protein n=1 Tax=Streptomyces sp. NPDC004647 TaxID=3154671 RepID=UPI0033B57ECD